MRLQLIGAAVLVFGTTAALAQDNDPQEAAAAATAATQGAEDEASAEELAEGEEVVCRRQRVTGSLSRVRRTCMTRNEWAELEARTRDAVDATNRSASGGQCVPVGTTGRC